MKTKKWYTSKTLWVAVIQAIIGLLVALEAVDPNLKVAGTAVLVKAFFDGALRVISVTELE